MKPLFLVLEGPDYTGKSTQAARLARSLRRRGRKVLHLREPGGTRIGERIREVLLDPSLRGMSIETELFLYMAARAQLVREVLAPALRAGTTVVLERFFYSTIVYQGIVGGLGTRAVAETAKIAVGGLLPDRVLLLDIDPLAGMRRGRKRGRLDRMERKGLTFQRKVRAGFLALARRDRRFVRIDAGGREEVVARAVAAAVEPLL